MTDSRRGISSSEQILGKFYNITLLIIKFYPRSLYKQNLKSTAKNPLEFYCFSEHEILI